MNRAAEVDAYVESAPKEARTHLERLREVIAEMAPHAEEVMKWNTPFYVEPRFLFAFSAHKSHVSFALVATDHERFRDELCAHETTKGLLKWRYSDTFPEELIRRIAAERIRHLAAREDSSFW